jgi:hypothetical protein
MTVSNATALVTNLEVGRDPLSAGTLTLGPGASFQVQSDISIARFGGSTGLVTVASGELVTTSNKVFVARGGVGELDVSGGLVEAASLLVAADTTNSVGATGTMSVTGGSVMLSSNLLVGSSLLSTGQVFISGGSLIVTNGAHTGNLAIPSGELVMSGGTITTDDLSLTNAAGQFAFHGGTFITKGTTLANGSPFVVGDGVAPAVLRLDGGTHSFANGLIISANATLEGCGTLVGSVINHGTISTNCGSTVVQFSIHFQGSVGTTNLISLLSTSGSSYTLEFKNLISDASWTPILPSTPGTGGTIVLQDAAANGPTRFYRVRAQ